MSSWSHSSQFQQHVIKENLQGWLHLWFENLPAVQPSFPLFPWVGMLPFLLAVSHVFQKVFLDSNIPIKDDLQTKTSFNQSATSSPLSSLWNGKACRFLVSSSLVGSNLLLTTLTLRILSIKTSDEPTCVPGRNQQQSLQQLFRQYHHFRKTSSNHRIVLCLCWSQDNQQLLHDKDSLRLLKSDWNGFSNISFCFIVALAPRIFHWMF
jgi:hypothetical protein